MKKYPYRVVTSLDYWDSDHRRLFTEIRGWLGKNVGKPYIDWVTDSYDGKYCVHFRRGECAAIFGLMWGG